MGFLDVYVVYGICSVIYTGKLQKVHVYGNFYHEPRYFTEETLGTGRPEM